MKAYITGASGFVGSYLRKVIPHATAIPHERVATYKLREYEYFYFLSTYGNMAHHEGDEKIIQANITDLTSILLRTQWRRVKSFVYVSSSSVGLPVQTMYSRSKRAAEELLLSFAQKYHAPVCIVRPFSITGVGEQKEHLIPRLIESCFTGTRVKFTATPRHDFIDVHDVVNGIVLLSQKGARGIYELGTGKSYSNQQALDIIERITGKKARIIAGRARPYDSTKWVSHDRGASKYGWTPRIRLEESIRAMVEAYEKTYQ